MMRSATTFLFCVCASFFLNAQRSLIIDESKAPILKFENTTHNFDTVQQGTYLSYAFPYTNTGSSALIIQNIYWSEGVSLSYCTSDSVAPGASSNMRFLVNTQGIYGAFDKIITVRSNNRFGDVQLRLHGVVEPLRRDPNAPVMVFDSTTYWFDTVYQGSIIDHEFRFTNRGKEPLLISNVCGSSGSVVPEWPKEPIAPGKSAIIRVVFHTGGRMGPQEKSVTITSNASEPNIVLRVKGVVILPPKQNEFPAPQPQNRIGQ